MELLCVRPVPPSPGVVIIAGMPSRYELPPLSYDVAALEPHLSARIVELHHAKHHQAYVDGANAVTEQLAEARSRGDFSALVGLEKTLAFHVSGHVLHSIYWMNLSPDGGGEPQGALADAIGEHFGDFTAFKAQLTQATVGVQGSGWALLSWDPYGQRLLIEQVENHQNNTVQAATPLLAIDAWEHAYYLQYENRRAEYASAIWNVVHWDDVARRFAEVSATALAEVGPGPGA
jgi:Fe-Mn family superoxide dismutase